MNFNKVLSAICIALLFALVAVSWHLGQIQGELIETRVKAQRQAAALEQGITALERQLAMRENELLAMQDELDKARQELEEMQQKVEDGLPRHFSSLAELKTWLANDGTDELEYSRDQFNCIAFALRLQERALTDGYILSTEVLPVAAHWVNIAVIDDTIYVIEPQDDSIILEKKINRRGDED
ncbi:hypothetical protein ES705_51112 [subsurface metagenome]|jgi:uncharacterized coiled-coil protein SlyX